MASTNYARLREQTMGSQEDEEAVTVNTRALIDKVLARYSGEWTTLRELIQNAADAQASKVTIRFETTPSSTIPLPSTQDPSDHLKHVLLHHTVKTLLVTNDGDVFNENDWQRLKRIAEGNPDETKIGAFGVGFYSVFADCETPFVSSGKESMAFYWKKDSLFTRRGKLSDDQAMKGTTFMLDYRSQSTPVPQLLGLCQFLATSLTFVGLECIDLYLDDWNILKLTKKMAPAMKVNIPKEVNPKTKDGLMKITDVEHQNAQIDAQWMNVVGWNRTLPSPVNATSQSQADNSGSLRGWFSKFTAGVSTNVASQKARKDEEALQRALVEDLAGNSRATVFLRVSTVKVQTFVSKSLSQELERATKKPPPKNTRIAILTSSYDESSASLSSVSGAGSKKATEIFSSVLPTKNGKIFIGFPTAQTTGLLAHISAPSVIPTVERESIDLNARYVRDWNVEMLRVAGIACRIAYAGELTELDSKLKRIQNGTKSPSKDDLADVMPSAIHICKQYHFEESTPSMKVGDYIEEAFWMCNKTASIDVLSTRGVLPSQDVRVATEDLSFVEGIPVVPDELMDKANDFLTKLRGYGLLSDITTSDIKKELEKQALSEKQLTELVKWACTKVSRQDMDASVVQSLFDGTVATINDEHVGASSSPVIQLGSISTFVNVSKIPAEMPTPPQTIPFRLTRGLSPSQLQSIGWEELQIVPWLRWIIESNSQGFGAGKSLTASSEVAAQVLPVVSKAWDALSQSSKQTVVELLTPRSVIPTKLGMRKPPQAYFASVKLFDDLPTIHGLQGVKEKFLGALGVRKTVELSVVFDRLMAKNEKAATGEEGKWSHVDLIKYLVSVKEDIPSEDIKRLRTTPLCTAETQSADQANKGKLYRVSELYEPNESIRKLGLPVLHWPGQYRPTSQEGRFLKMLGLQPYPSVPDLVNILAKAPTNSELQQSAINYWVINNYQNGYNQFPIGKIETAFLPVQPFEGERNNMVARPNQCYADPKASVLRFRILREDLQPHHAIFGVAMRPFIGACADRLIKQPPLDVASAKSLFGYFAGRLNEIGPNGNIAEQLGDAPIVPILQRASGDKKYGVRFIPPKACFIGDGQTYGDIFDFVDFGAEANTFLLRVGSKHEPSAFEIANMIVRQPARLLQTLGHEKYLQILRKIAENAAQLKKDKTLWSQLKSSPCLLAEKQVLQVPEGDEKVRELDDEELTVKEYSLCVASGMVLLDDFATYRLFQANLLVAPQEEVLENLYSALETPWLSKLVEDDQRMGAVLRDQTPAERLGKLIIERCRLFLYDHTADVIRHDAKWLDQNLNVKATEFLQVTRRLKGYRMQFVEKRTAALHRESKHNAILYVTGKYDLYEVARAIMPLLLKKPRQQDYLALEILMESDLRRLKTKGYNVDRILRAKAAEARVAESERQRKEEEGRRLAEEEGKLRAQSKALENGVAGGMANGMENGSTPQPQPPPAAPDTPERQLSMPGTFNDSPPTTSKGKKPSFFNSISKHLGINQNAATSSAAAQQMQAMLTNGHDNDAPPPYEPRDISRAGGSSAGTEQVSSPRDLHDNLESAVKASRAYDSNTLFSPPQTKDIKETPSYCDPRPGHDLTHVTTDPSGIKIFLSRSSTTPSSDFLAANSAAISTFSQILNDCATIFSLPASTLNIFHDSTGAAIAFNSSGSLFCNLRYFMQLHEQGMGSVEGRVDAMAYWWITLCHELAHNLVGDHGPGHSFYTESFVAQYFRRVVWWVGRQGVA
ncbi:uncharacterized protein LTR77_002723 [Saxophila tyrrhenica]|uniref:Sacsin/Nov domain-containing protein n=1 Tax=Saxophila tyrrhenica TaxID=1690608 RepID=A0AAV9PH45_9PEZI|nr:hypothetical protein LTR77_002723 [Saxophila tyrrhenica]